MVEISFRKETSLVISSTP